MTEITLRDIAAGDVAWLTRVHAELYAESDGFDASFGPLVAQILDDFQRDRDPSCERAFIAERGGTRLGSVFCVRSGAPGFAKLRLFVVLPEARGQGLGRRLLESCIGYAKCAGYRELRLWTHASHEAACALYRRRGFALMAEKPVHNFGRDLIEQTRSLAL
ncbi:MAG: GNAT family N-acetyltransferase [Alphaproteobacteria bacterium]|nr:GNAT family N-acetyltransferase [Alphaproteobacteria bacterium]NNF23565.1 GNAT family N-acetyltransferase [Paracoccaceae bacterium]